MIKENWLKLYETSDLVYYILGHKQYCSKQYALDGPKRCCQLPRDKSFYG